MRAVLAVLAWGCTACFSRPGDPIGVIGDDAGGSSADAMMGISDVMPDSVSDVGCTAGEPVEGFAATAVGCGGWAAKMGTGMAVQQTGSLFLTASNGADVRCESVSTTPFANGMVVRLSQYVVSQPGDGGYLEVTAAPANVRLSFMQVDPAGDSLEVAGADSPRSVPFSVGQMPWLRIRPAAGDRLEASYSPDGMNWITLGLHSVQNAAGSHVIALGATSPAGTTSIGIESLNICP